MTTRPCVVLTVIRYLGRIAMVLAAGALLLTAYVLWLAGKAGSVDPVAVAAVGAITTLLGTVLGALGALLVSVRSQDDEQPTLVEVVNTKTEPVPVDATDGVS